jgi:hypothetical protein
MQLHKRYRLLNKSRPIIKVVGSAPGVMLGYYADSNCTATYKVPNDMEVEPIDEEPNANKV